MPYPYRCGAVKSFPAFGKCPFARRDKSGHAYCTKKDYKWKDYLPCLFQKTYRKPRNKVLTSVT